MKHLARVAPAVALSLGLALAAHAPAARGAEDDLPLPAMPTDPGPVLPPPEHPLDAPFLASDDLRDTDPLEPTFAPSPLGVHLRGSVGLFGVTEPLSGMLLGGGAAGTVGVQLHPLFGVEFGARGAYGARSQVGGSVLFDFTLIPAISIAVGPTMVSPLREGEFALFGSVRTQLRLDRVGRRGATRRASLVMDIWLEPGMNYGVPASAHFAASMSPSAYFAFGGGVGLGVGWF